MEPRHWSAVAECLLDMGPAHTNRYWVAIALGTALRLSERYEESIDRFAQASRLRPASPRAYLALGRAYRGAGRRAEAIAALEEASSLGATRAAGAQLCRYGARDAAPNTQPHIHALADYPAFATLLTDLKAPEASSPAPTFHVHVATRPDCAGATETTLSSLRAQRYPHWTASVTDHPNHDAVAPGIWDLMIEAGTELHPEALGWIAWAASTTEADVIYSDHDQFVSDTSGVRVRGAPTLYPMADRIWFSQPGCGPQLKAQRPFGGTDRSLAHIPLVLGTLPPKPQEQLQPETTPNQQRISVIIPTRDNPALLERCVETLLATAACPDRVELVIVDNSSVHPETVALLGQLTARSTTRVVPFTAPFNWSRANNLGAAAAEGDHFLFLNDDTEMLTPAWDNILADLLNDPLNGVVGVRMIYPDGTIQHAGFVFGMGDGPQHEGRWIASVCDGPAGRWAATRQAAAVTGAFIATRRDLFEEIGGFDDARLAIDFADLDMCLRVRAMGKAVIYTGAITALHHESVSRGFNRSRAKRRRVRRELDIFLARWGDAAIADPGYNPLWTREDCSFDGYVVPKMADICRHIRLSAEANPWQVPPPR